MSQTGSWSGSLCSYCVTWEFTFSLLIISTQKISLSKTFLRKTYIFLTGTDIAMKRNNRKISPWMYEKINPPSKVSYCSKIEEICPYCPDCPKGPNIGKILKCFSRDICVLICAVNRGPSNSFTPRPSSTSQKHLLTRWNFESRWADM